MKKEKIKEYIAWFHEKEKPNILERELKPRIFDRKATVIIGPRRSGKTFLLFSLIDWSRIEEYVYLDFENPLLFGVTSRDFPEILKAYYELYPENVNKRIFFFLDEIQNVKDWERGVRYLLDDGHFVVLTGSSSKLLSKEVATQLRGRSITYVLLPLSFREFLLFRGIRYNTRSLYGKEMYRIKKFFEEFLRFGGFPEVALYEEKIRILNEYIDTIIRKDILERFRIRNIAFMDALIEYLVNNYGKYITYNSIFKLFKQDYKITKRTVLNYLKYLEESFFIFFLKKFSKSKKEEMRSPKKVYLVDQGFGIFGRKDVSRDLENVVFLELLRKKFYENPLMEIKYYRSDKEEIDFVVKDGEKFILIQVTKELHSENFDREVDPLFSLSKKFKTENLYVITLDQEEEIKRNGKIVKVIPIWKWLLVPNMIPST